MKIDVLRTVVTVAFVATAMLTTPAVAGEIAVFNYSLPAAWDGTGPIGTAVIDQSAAGNDGVTTDDAGNGGPVLSAMIPPGAPAGTMSLDSQDGGLVTNATSLLTNSILAPHGGFRFDMDIFWNGTNDHSLGFGIQKLIDVEGVEALQLQDSEDPNAPGTANLKFLFNDPDDEGPSVPIVANQWYSVSAVFDTLGNSVDGMGFIDGIATLTVDDGINPPVVVSQVQTKKNRDDAFPQDPDPPLDLDRPIAIGTFVGFSGILNFEGLIYNPSVSFLNVPEPTSLVLLSVGTIALQMRRRRTQ